MRIENILSKIDFFGYLTNVIQLWLVFIKTKLYTVKKLVQKLVAVLNQIKRKKNETTN